MSIRAVGFDLDATLARTDRSRAALLREAIDRADSPEFSRREYLAAHDEHSGDDTREAVFAALLADRETTTDPATLAAAYREALADALVPVGDVVGLLAALRDQYRVGLLTDGPVETQRGKLDHLGWTDLFDTVVVTGSLPAPKPDRRAFDALTDGLDIPSAQTAYVGDHPEKDIAGAHAAGMVPVQACHDGGPEPHPDAAATVRRDRLTADLPAVLASLTDASTA